MTSPGERPRTPHPQIGLVVRLERTSTFSPRRTRSAVAAWFLFLVGIVAIGVVTRIPDADLASNPAAEAGPQPTPLTTRGVAALSGPVPTPHHSLGEEGLMGGIVFGDNVPRLTQADIERDGYRYYGQLLARDAGTGR